MYKRQDKFCSMTLKGVTYTEKADAGEMLLAICKDYPMSAPTEIGSYRGFRMEIYYATVNAHYCMNLCGKDVYYTHLCEFAERMQKNGETYEPKPAEQTPQKTPKHKDLER